MIVGVIFFVVCAVLRAVLGLVVLPCRGEAVKDVELLVLLMLGLACVNGAPTSVDTPCSVDLTSIPVQELSRPCVLASAFQA
jgi:hypothetical protein